MIVTSFQIFAIGAGMAAAGPCLVSCLPLILAYTWGGEGRMRLKLGSIGIYLSGRLIAYVLLGACAGLSAAALKGFTSHAVGASARLAAGLISIGLGILFIMPGERSGCPGSHGKLAAGSVFLAGFVTGISPCGPLLALLSEIVLISRNAWQGAWFGLAFGLGTFLSAFAVTAGFSGVIHHLSSAAPEKRRRLLRIFCGAALIVMGILYSVR
jgi:sulfite exporter TauE/SafE